MNKEKKDFWFINFIGFLISSSISFIGMIITFSYISPDLFYYIISIITLISVIFSMSLGLTLVNFDLKKEVILK